MAPPQLAESVLPVEWVAPVRERSAKSQIGFRVYGARVERTETAVHVVFHRLRRNPNTVRCGCTPCLRDMAPVTRAAC